MPYKLKKNTEAFQVVDGPFAGRKYEHDKIFADADVPPQEMNRFEKISEPKTPKITTEKDEKDGGKK